MRLLQIAARIRDPADGLGQRARERLPAATGLSPEGVELALREHLEHEPSLDEIDALLASARASARCWVVLAANVCTAALRAIALACACAPDVRVRPSRRDPVLAELLVETLADPGVQLCAEIAPHAGDQLHVYGSDETVALLRARQPDGVALWAHGTGLGIAAVPHGSDLAAAATGIARDVVPFDQQGCLSPRFVLVEGDETHGRRLGDLLHQALAAAGRRVPRGPLDDATRSAVQRFRATAETMGPCWVDSQHLVTLDDQPGQLLLPPAARCLTLVAGSLPVLEACMEHWARFVTTVGCDDREAALLGALRSLCPQARPTDWGAMQRPPFDGPVDRRAG
jgi:hypothetical protein